MGKSFYALLVSLFFVAGCAQDKQIYGNVPVIEFNSFSVDTVQQYTGVFTMVLGFTDGDGDLGTDNENIQNMLIIDSRDSDTTYYRIPPFAPTSLGSLQGAIEVDVPAPCCLEIPTPCQNVQTPTSEQVSFTVKIQDNAGNWSNEVLTPPLNLRCF